MESGIIDILIFAAIAGTLVWRLRGVLGRRYDQDDKDKASGESMPVKPAAELVDATPPEFAEESPHGAAFHHIRQHDPDFEQQTFLDGARQAFGMIVSAFAEGDMSNVRFLLSESVMQAFTQAIDARKDGTKREVLEIISADITDVDVNDSGQATITVSYTSQQSIQTSEDDQPQERRVNDEWTFARDLRSDDPAWLLVKTSA
ncbi:MAG: Tim44/TimA family putative adaptor protein [Pseudomonadota bacterium]